MNTHEHAGKHMKTHENTKTAAADMIGECTWAVRTARMQVGFHERSVLREGTWLSELSKTQTSEWLRTCRILAGSESEFGGRSGTRTRQGRVPVRWPDSVDAARKVGALIRWDGRWDRE